MADGEVPNERDRCEAWLKMAVSLVGGSVGEKRSKEEVTSGVEEPVLSLRETIM